MSKQSDNLKILRTRPLPAADIADPLNVDTPIWRPAPEVDAWLRLNIIGEGPLYNPDHDHLMMANIGFLWTNCVNKRSGVQVIGQCEIPQYRNISNRWQRDRLHYQLIQWFGEIPDFVITLDAVTSLIFDDASWCALVEHELYHTAQALDKNGEPAFNEEGKPKFKTRPHDVEEHVGVVERYGITSASRGVQRLYDAIAKGPQISAAKIAAACGTCNSYA